MKIKRVKAVGLIRRENTVEGVFSPDLNILTGRNGAGKTTLLKLIWYIISGNIFEALKEVNFRSINIETDDYNCTVIRTSKFTCKVELDTPSDGLCTYEDSEEEDGVTNYSAEDLANPVLSSHGSSLFFPTFRRLEGGFSLTRSRPMARRSGPTKTDIEEALTSVSYTHLTLPTTERV